MGEGAMYKESGGCMYDRNSLNIEYLVQKLAERTWSEILDALGVAYRKDRGGKYRISRVFCEGHEVEGDVVFYPDQTFLARGCGECGDMLDYIGNQLDFQIAYYDEVTDELVEQFLDSLPRRADHRQMWLFSPKWFALGHHVIPCGSL